jgi:enoyl-CoA hydratase/carnithine racemase
MRLSLLGAHERLSAQRAFDIGLVSELVPGAELREAAGRAAAIIASQPPLAIQGTVRALWSGLDHTRAQSLDLAYAYVGLGTSQDSLDEGQRVFASGRRVEWRLR